MEKYLNMPEIKTQQNNEVETISYEFSNLLIDKFNPEQQREILNNIEKMLVEKYTSDIEDLNQRLDIAKSNYNLFTLNSLTNLK